MFPTGKRTHLLTNEDDSAKHMYLFTHYRQLTCDQVAASCKYYALNVRYPIITTVNDITTTTKGNFTMDWLSFLLLMRPTKTANIMEIGTKFSALTLIMPLPWSMTLPILQATINAGIVENLIAM